jgi:hypothetical protein
VVGCALTIAYWHTVRSFRLGALHFPTSCNWQVQRDFTAATALLHLLQIADAEVEYTRITERDPDCAIAYWGIAMSRLKNPLYERPTTADMEVARRALTTALSARSASPRERAYLAAVGLLFKPTATPENWLEQQVAYAKSMERLVRDYPEDREAVIFYALALNFTAANLDRARSNRTRAEELLLEVFNNEPDHPGIGHYLIYCLGHIAYQPKPFEGDETVPPRQRFLFSCFAFLSLFGLGAFMIFTSNVWSGAGGSSPIGGSFALTASDGRIVTDRTFRGRWMLVYFGYTNCPEVCPTTLLAITEVLEHFSIRLGVA